MWADRPVEVVAGHIRVKRVVAHFGNCAEAGNTGIAALRRVAWTEYESIKSIN